MPHDRKHHSARFLAPARIVGFLEFVFRRSDSSGDIFPQDEPRGFVEGPDPQRVLVLGEANAVGLGTTQHALGMAGHFGRLLASLTGRGVHWSAVPVRGNRIHNAWEVIEDERDLLARTDVVIVMMGIVDTLSLTSRGRWAADLSHTLDCLTEALPHDATILLTCIPPMDNAGSISKLARFAAGRQARLFNRVSESIARQHRICRTVAFPQDLRQQLWVPQSRQEPYVAMYSAWSAAAVAEFVSERGAPVRP